jgi:photosystem II stability/assembly factor-like uncharacterized protein
MAAEETIPPAGERAPNMLARGAEESPMRRSRLSRCLDLLLLLSLVPAAARAEANRWESIGPGASPPSVPTVYSIAWGGDGTPIVAQGLGIFRYSGGGLWQPILQVPLGHSEFPGRTFGPFQSVQVQRDAPGTLLAGHSLGGLYRSVDGGVTWSIVVYGSGFLSLASAPSSPSVAYTSVLLALPDQAANLRSSDGGASWAPIAALGSSPVQALAVDPTSSGAVLASVGASAEGLPRGLYRTRDGGGSWTRLAGGLAEDLYTALVFDPAVPTTIYAGSSAHGVYRSDDAGDTWRPVNDGLDDLRTTQIAVDSRSPATLYAGTMRGVFRSVDGGANWASVGLHQEKITALALDPVLPETLYAGVVGGLERITLAPVAPCAADAGTLCLNDGRFRVQVVWRGRVVGTGGAGQAVPITDDTGGFWFFDADNVELVVKVLDGSGVNGHFWVFSAGLSNVEYTITATDTASGTIQSYFNYQGYGPRSVADTAAFPAAAGSASAPSARARAASRPLSEAVSCDAGADALCLLGGRYRVAVEFRSPANAPAQSASAVVLTPDAGYFWFFDAENVELVVKVLDGTAVNGHVWVFYGALSNVAYTIRVVDTLTGAEKEYVNPAGRLASLADTAAF